jgi:hemerythrin
MGLITWDDRLATGHPKIDEQHKALIETFNGLHAAMKQGKGREEVGRILAYLGDYTATHFGMEEELMAASAYPGMAKHKGIHADLLVQVGDLVAKYGQGAVLTLPVMNFLEDWLVVHIQGEDFRLASHLKGKDTRLAASTR